MMAIKDGGYGEEIEKERKVVDSVGRLDIKRERMKIRRTFLKSGREDERVWGEREREREREGEGGRSEESRLGKK